METKQYKYVFDVYFKNNTKIFGSCIFLAHGGYL